MDIMTTLFNISVTGSVIYLIFSCIKPLTKKYFNSSGHYNMLVLTLVFFIIPVAGFIEVPINITPSISETEALGSGNTGNFIKPDERENTQIAAKDVGKSKPIAETKTEVNNEKPSIIETTNNVNLDVEFNIYNYIDIIKHIWIIGMIVVLSIKVIPYIKFKSAIKMNSLEVTDEGALEIFNQCKNELNIRDEIPLRTSGMIDSPMLIGLSNPMVLIPSIDSNDKTSRMIFLHELNHYKRKDILMKVFGVIINAIHWFNPIIYILLKEINRYCEFSIDEKVVDDMNLEDRKYYGETILTLIDNSIVIKNTLTTAMGSSGKELKSRLKNMIYSSKSTRKRYIMSLLISVLVISSGLTVACNIIPTETIEYNDSLVVYIKEDGLYYSYLNGKTQTKIHDGNSFEYPLVSHTGII